MKQATMILTGLLVFGMAFLPAGSAEEVEGTYAISATPGVSVTACPSEVDFCTGGYIFSADLYDSEPLQVDIADASGGAVDATVCQNFDGEFCGSEGDPRVDGCATSFDLGESEEPFVADTNTAVFIRLWDPECPDTVATSGTITLSF